ncbi:MAG: thiamine diphosphokinase [Anaerovoracaceae bacterium]
MNRCVIVGGAPIENYDELRSFLKPDDYMIYCDCGLRHINGLRKEPALIVGDFDSYSNPEMEAETIVLPCEKDDTDTFFAVKEALRRGFEDFLLVGVVGKRLDHTLGNISILLMLDSAGKKGNIIDDFSEMEIVSDRYKKPCNIDDSYAYFSLINISGTARGVTIRGAKYPLEDAEITCEYQYGVSNEVIPGCTAEVSVEEGRLLLIKVR